MMDWLAKMLGLPEEFLHSSEGSGGGVIQVRKFLFKQSFFLLMVKFLQGTASEATLVALLTAKEKMVRKLKEENPQLTEDEIKAKLVSYSSDQSNSSVEKASIIGSMPMRLLPADENGALRGQTLQDAIRADREAGLYPCYLVATLGTTGTCAFDNLEELGPICQKEDIWFHVDAAYAGAAFVCPEYRYLMKGIEFVDSFNFNPHKWMLVNFDCSAFWVRDERHLAEAFNIDRIYLKTKYQGIAPEYRNWQIPLGRKMRAMKLFFVIRSYGVEGIQKYIRNHITLARYFADLLEKDSRFEMCTCSLGLVCFRIKGECALTKTLLEKLMATKKLYMVPCHYREKFVIRLAICSRIIQIEDIDRAWNIITTLAEEIFATINKPIDSIITEKRKITDIEIGTKVMSQSTEKSK